MSDLQALITKTLGIATLPPEPTIRQGPTTVKAPPRPAELYKYIVRYYRTEYGSCVVEAESGADAENTDMDIDWDDCGDTELSEVELCSKHVINQDDIDAWDAQYEDHFDHDGDPMCTGCRNYQAPNKDPLERSDKDEGYGWYCQDCL